MKKLKSEVMFKVICIEDDWHKPQQDDPKVGDECTVIREYHFGKHPIYVLAEFPRPGGYDATAFARISDIDERSRLEAWQEEQSARLDEGFRKIIKEVEEV